MINVECEQPISLSLTAVSHEENEYLLKIHILLNKIFEFISRNIPATNFTYALQLNFKEG